MRKVRYFKRIEHTSSASSRDGEEAEIQNDLDVFYSFFFVLPFPFPCTKREAV